MVIFAVKKNELEFRVQTSLEESVDFVIKMISNLSNSLIKLQRVLDLFPDLVKYGPLRPEEYRGLTSEELIDAKVIEQEKSQCAPNNPCYMYNPDPSGYRCGKAPLPDLQQKMNSFVDEVKNFLSKPNLSTKIITVEDLNSYFSKFNGYVKIAYPGGLPPYDQLHGILFAGGDIDTTPSAKEIVDESTAMLWFSGKKIERGQTLAQNFPKTRGFSEKSTLKVQLTHPTAHPPARETAISDDEKKAMMAYYYKKQREAEEASKDPDDSYLTKDWANPHSLKNKLTGGGGSVAFK